jgi:lipopolysaccharide export system permease protein
MNLWQRYLFWKLASTFLFFLISFFLIYAVVDLSMHSVRFFADGQAPFVAVARYYLSHFSAFLNLFFPLAFLLSSIRVLSDLSSHGEIVALQMAGLSAQRLLAPFTLFACALSLTAYVNAEWWAPDSLAVATTFREKHAPRHKRDAKAKVQTLPLTDRSELVFQAYDPVTETLHDVFWLRSSTEFWHMKTLTFSPLTAHYADRFIRGRLVEKAESFETLPVPQLLLLPEDISNRTVPFEQRSLSQLIDWATSARAEASPAAAHLHYKLAVPLLPLLLLAWVAPYCLRFHRFKQTFLIALLALGSLFTLFTLLDGMLILAESQVLPSYLAIWGPLAALWGGVMGGRALFQRRL